MAQFSEWASDQLNRIAIGTNIHRPSPSQSFYKYIGLNNKSSWNYFERTLNECILVGSTVHSLNDPFEGKACIFDDLHTLRYEPSLSAGFERDPKEGKLIDDQNTLGAWRDQASTYLASMTGRQRIVSFCERSDSPLLWSHYANSYRGACLHFLGRAFPPISTRIGYVRYTNTRPDYPLRLALELSRWHNSSTMAESDKILFFTKALDWAYESEIRLIYDVDRGQNRFESTGLVSIILGPSMDAKTEDRLKSIVLSSTCTHVKIRRARLSRNAFSIEISQSDDENDN